MKAVSKDPQTLLHASDQLKADKEVVLASSSYDVDVPAVVGKGNVLGTQFHPEKSSEIGLAILQNYADIVEGRIAT